MGSEHWAMEEDDGFGNTVGELEFFMARKLAERWI